MCYHLDHIFCTVTCILEIPLMAILSLCLDHLKVDKLSKGFLFVCCLFSIHKMWTLLTYKDNEHLAMKCIVLHTVAWVRMTLSLQICGCLGTDCTFVVTMVTSVYLQPATGCSDEEQLEGSGHMWHTCLHHGTMEGDGGLWWFSTLLTFCEYKCKNAEAHSVFLLLYMEKLLISCHNTSWYFTVI